MISVISGYISSMNGTLQMDMQLIAIFDEFRGHLKSLGFPRAIWKLQFHDSFFAHLWPASRVVLFTVNSTEIHPSSLIFLILQLKTKHGLLKK